MLVHLIDQLVKLSFFANSKYFSEKNVIVLVRKAGIPTLVVKRLSSRFGLERIDLKN